MLSVGVDIGTSTSQLIFSRLYLENQAGYFSVPSVSIVEKEVIYQSPVYETPLLNEVLIDGDELAAILEKEYRSAGVNPSHVETGAVIITGESARKENASMILERLSRFAGDFVVSTAGPDLESLIAGQGSGAQHLSEMRGERVLNFDIGGGTTNAALFDRGECVSCGCLDIGGRQVRVDVSGVVRYISPSAERIIREKGIKIRTGEQAEEAELYRLCREMAFLLEQFAGIVPETPLLSEIRTKGSGELLLAGRLPVHSICFSGGVGECIRQPGAEPLRYGDIGVLLGRAIRESRLFSEFHVMKALQTIRATVIGAGSHTTTISGSTVDYAKEILPMKNVPVLKLSVQEEEKCWMGQADFLYDRLCWFLRQNDAQKMVLAFKGRRDPEYRELSRLSDTLVKAMDQALPANAPIVLIVQEDMAKALGQILKRKLGGQRHILSLDSVQVKENNFVDFGKPQMDGLVVPVVVKTLIFN